MAYGSEAAYFKPLPGIEKLPSSYVNHIIQRKDGFIWMATAEGISRYDGRDFINHQSILNNLNSLPNSWVNWMLEDHKQQLWAGTATGLARMLPDEISFEQYLFSPSNVNSISGNNIIHLFEDSQNRLWIATDRGLSLYQADSNDFKNFYISGDIKNVDDNYVSVINQKDANHLWIGGLKGLYLFNIESGSFTKHEFSETELHNLEVSDLAIDSTGALWVVTSFNGVIKMEASSHKITVYRHQADNPDSISSDELWTIALDKDDNVWLTSWGKGINQIDTNGAITRHQHRRGDNRSIPSNLTTAVFVDDVGLIWIATYNGVVLHQPVNPVESIQPIPGQINSLSSEMVWAIEETDDAFWFGTTEGLNRWDKATNSIEHYYSGLGDENSEPNNFASIWDLIKISNELLWVGTENGLAQFDTQTKQLLYLHENTKKPPLSEGTKNLLENPVWILNERPDGSLWVGTNNSALYLVDKDHKVIKNYTETIQTTLAQYDNVEFTNIIENIDGNLWLSTATGLFFFNTENNTIAAVRNNNGETLFDKDWIYAIQKHWNNQYWVATLHNGLSLLEFNSDGTVNRLLHLDHSHPNIKDQSIYNIFPLNENEVWFTGRRNLYHLDFNNKKVTNYGSSYFESNISFHENSQYISTDGKLFMGSNRGVIKFDYTRLQAPKKDVKIYITEINSNDLSVATHLNDSNLSTVTIDNNKTINTKTPIHKLETFTFPHHNLIINFKFAALDYLNAENLNYAYRLPQLDDHWIELQNNNELTLTNLEAGDYQLQIKTTKAGFGWSDYTAAINFNILPKPWFTWWAKLLYFLFAAVIALMIFRLYRSRLITQYALQHREVQLSQAIWGSGDELWEWDIEKQEITRTNSAELTDDRKRTFTGTFAGNNLKIHPDDIEQLQHKISDILTGKSDEFDAVYRQKNNQGNWVWIQDRARVTSRSFNNKPLIVNGISRNINTIKEKEERSLLIASAFQSSSDGAIVLDADFKIISINAAFTAITGFDDRIINKFMPWRAGPISTNEMQSSELFQMISKVVINGGSYHDEVFITTVHNKLIPIDLRVNCIYNNKKEPSHYIATITDITYRKHTEEELKQLANYDSLTGLPNRSLMMIKLKQSLEMAEHKGNKMAVMFVDLDHFKNINDSLGHTIGDELLIAAANRLSHCIRKSDMVARIGGDEFTIGILDYDNISDVIRVAENVLKKMAKPFQLTNHELIITPSIGIATYNEDDDGIDIETLLMQADTAMYHAKKTGRNNFQFFTESMNQAVLNRVDIEMKLRKALKNQELVLHYQPKFNLATDQITGFEALIRWRGIDRDLIPPDDFIPIAEETGLIASIGEFVIESACKQLHEWQQNGHQNIHVAINLSAVQFMDKKLVVLVSRVLEKYQISPQSLELEITESTLIENLQYTIKTLHELRKLGVKLSLDDFGTGFSSLNYLKQFPIHALKIDRSFIKDIVLDSRDASMVDSIITLAHNLDIEVVAEGVETMEQLHLLESYNIEEVQGFLLSKPFDVDAASAFLNSGQTVSGILAERKTTDCQ